VVAEASTGQPVAGVCPLVTPAATSQLGASCSGADGRYVLSGLGPYHWRVVFPDYSGAYAWQWSGGASDRFAARPVRAHAGGTANLDACLRATGTVTGRIVNTSLPNQFITVFAINARTGDFAGPLARVAGAAEYTLTGLATQQVLVGFYRSGDDILWYPDPVAIAAGDTVTGIDIVVPTG
jgi:hypothetical protein